MLAQSALLIASFTASALAGSCSISTHHRMTFYGYPDNDPAGANVRYNCGGRGGKASGSGTYENPLTVAVAHGRYAECEIIYSPYLKKYLRVEDSCANCHGNWLDVWLGPTDHDAGSSLVSCQHTLTGSNGFIHSVIEKPPQGLEVNSAELYSGGKCHVEACSLAANENPTCSGGSAPVASPKEAAKTPETKTPETKAPEIKAAEYKAPESNKTPKVEEAPGSPQTYDPPANDPHAGSYVPTPEGYKRPSKWSDKDLKVSPDGTCGGNTGFTCLGSWSGDCCSKWGWCGKTNIYCKKSRGCQEDAGKCRR